jgi:CHAT domain-containing protein
LELARGIDHRLNNTQGEVRHLQNIADVYQRQGDYDKALEVINEILSIYQNFDYAYGVAMCFNSLAQVYLLQGDYETALKHGYEALKWSNETQDDYIISSSYTTLGVVLHFMGNYPLSLDYYNQAKTISEASGDLSHPKVHLSNLANLYSALGFYEKASSYYLEVLQIAQTENDTYLEASVLGNIAMLYVRLKNYELALEYNLKTIKIAEEINLQAVLANALMANAEIRVLQKDYASAETDFIKSLEISQLIDSKTNISNCYSGLCSIEIIRHNYDRAFYYGKEGLRFAMITKTPSNLYSALINLYHAYIKINQPDLALLKLSEIRQLTFSGLETNFFSLSEKEREAYFTSIESNLDPYFDFGLFYQKNYPEITDTLFNLALTTKGISLKSSTFLRQSILASEDSTLIADYNQLLKLRKEIETSVDTENTEQEELANTLEKNIVKRSDAFSDFKKIKSIDWTQVRESLKPGECAIEFVNFESYIDSANPKIYGALVVHNQSKHPDFVKLCTEDDLIEIMGSLQGNNLGFVNAVYGTKEKAQTALYQKIWQPIEPYIENASTIYYSPSGLLHKISFGSLCKSQNVFLADLYNLRQMGSTTSLAMNSDVSFGALENFLLMGGVNFNSTAIQKETWSYLPGSLNETNAIHAALQKKKFGVNYFTGDNATEEIFKEKITSSSIVHIATHGFFFPDPEQVRAELRADDENNSELIFRGNNITSKQGTTNYANWTFVNNQNPLMRSGIVLSGANDVWSRNAQESGEDGILTAAEVSNLDLRNTKLVVLSACETGLGDIKGSEGVYGLQRAFKMAGVKYLIMSLWQVPDKETSEFMILFYKNLIKLKDIPAAFQKTQKVMRENYDPYYWGAFVLIE